jgi:hypothetical protein
MVQLGGCIRMDLYKDAAYPHVTEVICFLRCVHIMKYNTATLVFLLIRTIYVEMWSCGNLCSVHISNEAYPARCRSMNLQILLALELYGPV